jgi:hypothetical protein
MNPGVHKMLGISLVADRMSAFQRLGPMELAGWGRHLWSVISNCKECPWKKELRLGHVKQGTTHTSRIISNLPADFQRLLMLYKM